MGNVVPFTAPPRRRPHIVTAIKVADTGSRPFLCHASDGHEYWCKELHSAHEREAAINEVVVSIIGEEIGAPVRPWAILDIPEDLASTSIGQGELRRRMPAGPLFGSLNLHQGRVSRDIEHVPDDGNYNRFPMLVALAELCMADDVQFLYDPSDDNKVWSLDHGFWFGSHEAPWEFFTIEGFPRVRTPIPSVHWDKAIDAVRQLNSTLEATIAAKLPQEWNVKDQEIHQLAAHVLSGKPACIDKLEQYKSVYERRHGQ